ncbi:NAD(P)/FAD-dependent oxidoreductase [Bdellovibrio bacteriovorus]|uniref:NADH:ubiquinone reductase (non-electrogenic) n=1 Tax=Bdellovibrio bacteriovorus str. Tiberius TaxID=1069642 RepID=K7ZE06_BDEBC|nr:NAD(P)/FAD-dependent oxidoreductase [Bdellovibrio bacteriovorus]AFY00037.1 NADH dehydrogenase [Bdellovibrio bacteriovorus str. Tiberius]
MPKKVVIVGGGFAGLKAARAFGNKEDVSVTLIDRRNYHLFQPLLYQVATAGLSPAEISGPIRGILSKYKNVSVFLDNLESVDLKNKKIQVPDRTLDYDYLILACGAKHSYFAHPEWEENAPGLKTLEQATEIRRRLLMAFERAEKETDPEKQKQQLTFVIVGAGPTGVELAGTIGEISRHTLTKDFRHIDPSRTRVILIEAGPRILAAFHPDLSRKAAADLEDLGVQIWTNTRVTDVKSDSVVLGDEVIKAATILWAAGVQPSSINKTLGVPLDRAGRVIIEKDLSLKEHPEVFILGDQACYLTDNGQALPGLASVAMQQGTHAANQILREIDGKPRLDFKYLDKGQMATIGRRKAIAQISNLKFSGFFAWILWLFIHVYYLIGFKNRVFVIWQWAYSYFTFKRGARLIVDKEWRSKPKPPVS